MEIGFANAFATPALRPAELTDCALELASCTLTPPTILSARQQKEPCCLLPRSCFAFPHHPLVARDTTYERTVLPSCAGERTVALGVMKVPAPRCGPAPRGLRPGIIDLLSPGHLLDLFRELGVASVAILQFLYLTTYTAIIEPECGCRNDTTLHVL